MRLPPYPKYKPSGVEWLGDMPEQWGVKALKYALSGFVAGGTPEVANEAYWANADEAGHYWVSITDMTRSPQIRSTDRRITEAGRASRDLRVVPPGTLLYSMYASLGKVAVLEIPAAFNQAILALLPDKEGLSQRYLHFWLNSMEVRLELFSSSNTQDNLNAAKVRGMPLFVPKRGEQRVIAAFLDRETTKIDTLVTKKQALIERLKEKRTALISRTVTRGLPPDAARAASLDPHPKLKPSGIDWLGDIPAHWDILPFTKYVAEKSDYRGKTPEKQPDGVFLVTARNVRMGFIDYESSQEFITEEDYDEVMRRGLPKKGDILFTTEAPLGNVALVDRQDIALAQRIIRFRMSPTRYGSAFALFAMMSDHFQVQLKSLSTGSTAEGLKASKLPILRLIAPPLSEQAAIAAYLGEETAKLDALVGKVSKAVERLQEYRTALITAAVTGKIDVRG